MKQKIDLKLPEWAFLDGTSHLGNELEGRDVLLCLRTNTIIEFLSLDKMEINLKYVVKQKKFIHINLLGIEETYLVIVHYCKAEFTDLDEVIDKAIEYFKAWMTWMDESIIQEDTSKIN
jgi:hypothetical protein